MDCRVERCNDGGEAKDGTAMSPHPEEGRRPVSKDGPHIRTLAGYPSRLRCASHLRMRAMLRTCCR